MYDVRQLVQKVCAEYPNNGFVYDQEVGTNTQVEQGMIDYINSALARAEKYILKDEIYEFPTIAGQAIYELPLDCKLKNIMEVTRTFGNKSIRLRWGREAERLYGLRYFNAYGNMIGLAPVPHVDGETVTIFYKHTPMKVNTIDDPVEIEDEWIDLLVYSIVSDMSASGSNPDIELSNNYRMRYNALLQDAMLEKTNEEPYYPQTKDNKRPPIQILRRGYRW